MNSKIYVGQVSHKRYQPHTHGFKYRMFMMYLDLDELPCLFDRFLFWSSKRFNLAWFNRKHHLGDENTPLKQAVTDLVYSETGIRLKGPVRLLTHLSYFGHGFNPVSFYYCYDERGENIETIVVEVNNTPWGEQFCYVLPADKVKDADSNHIYHLNKSFHVSPFLPMDQEYEWQLSEPGENLSVCMKNYADNEKVFNAVLALKQQEISSLSLARMLSGFPLMTLKIVTAIYYEAFRLWLKGTPIFDHPGKNDVITVKK